MYSDRHVTAHKISDQIGMFSGSVKAVIHEHLRSRNMSISWVQKQLIMDQKKCEEHLHYPYIPKLASSDFHIFDLLKQFM